MSFDDNDNKYSDSLMTEILWVIAETPFVMSISSEEKSMEERNEGVKEQGFSRRDFVRGAAALGLSGAAVSLAACAQEGAGATESPDVDTLTWDEEYDVVVMGSGYAGLAAAIEAKGAGADVIILEKNFIGGGNSIMCGGYIQAGGGTSVQKAAGIEDTPERFYRDIFNFGHHRGQPELIRKYVDNSPALIDWLGDLGLNWNPQLQKMEGMTVDCTHVPAEGDTYPGVSGISSWVVMNNEVTRLGIETRLNHKGVRLIQRPEDKAVLGVEVETPDGTKYFKGKRAVVLATGGYKANLAMRNNWDPRIDADVSAGGLPYVESLGELSEAAVDIGAAQREMSFVCEFRFKWGTKVYQYWEPTSYDVVPNYSTGFPVGNFNYVMIVKNDGRRCVDEHAANEYPQWPFYEAFLDIEEKPRSVWVLTDSSAAETLNWDLDVLRDPDPDTHPHLHPERVAVADTIEELASMMGIDATGLKAEVERYNGFVDAGVDGDFGKKELPNKIETGPFYALKVQFFAHDQQSGLTVNTLAQVVSRASYFGDLKSLDQREIIPHLYSAGEVSGGYFGQERGHSKIGVHMFWGRVAGEQAANEPEIV
jgi:flavocytochrome c